MLVLMMNAQMITCRGKRHGDGDGDLGGSESKFAHSQLSLRLITLVLVPGAANVRAKVMVK